jgi:hypothetical protein
VPPVLPLPGVWAAKIQLLDLTPMAFDSLLPLVDNR